MEKILVASDHAGFALKQMLIQYIGTLGHEVEDLGDITPTPDDDYPDYVMPLAERIAKEGGVGIVLGKSGEGEAMCANRVKGVRAFVYYGGSLDIPRLARQHNNANVISLGAGFLSEEEAKQALKIFLEEPFSNDPRHVRRLAKF